MRERVLVVDDDRMICEAFRNAFEFDYEMTTAGTLSMAEVYVRTRAFDVILLDAVLGREGSSIDFARRIRAGDFQQGGTGKDVVIICVSGAEEHEFYLEIRDGILDGFASKNFLAGPIGTDTDHIARGIVQHALSKRHLE